MFGHFFVSHVFTSHLQKSSKKHCVHSIWADLSFSTVVYQTATFSHFSSQKRLPEGFAFFMFLYPTCEFSGESSTQIAIFCDPQIDTKSSPNPILLRIPEPKREKLLPVICQDLPRVVGPKGRPDKENPEPTLIPGKSFPCAFALL